MEKNGLIREANKEQSPLLILVNFTDVTNDRLSAILKEFGLKCDLKLINDVTAANNYKECKRGQS